MTVWSATVLPVPLLALALALHGRDAVLDALMHPTPAAVLSTRYTAWVASLLGYGIWNTLLARHPEAAVVPYATLVPVVGLTTSWLVQGEVPHAWEATGGAVLLLGVAVTTGVLRAGRRVRRGPSVPGGGSPAPAAGPAPEDPAPTPAR
jgi:O-acetylserine/cysteine efflux transporter